MAGVSRFTRLALLVVIGAGPLTGCALTPRNATLIYPPAEPEGAVSVAHAATPPASNGISITVLPFVDRRADTTKVGGVRNGFGMKLASIRTVNSVAAWVPEALTYELKAAGYAAAPAATAPDTSLAISGEILKAETDAYFTYGGEVELLVTLTDGDRELIRRTYIGKGSGGTNWGATAKSYAQSLSMALADVLRQVIADVGNAVAAE